MNAKQFREVCEGIQSISSGLDSLLRVAKNLDEKDKYDAQIITNIGSIMTNANNLLAQQASQFIIDAF